MDWKKTNPDYEDDLSLNISLPEEEISITNCYEDSKMTPEELGMDQMFVDDPRAVSEIQYGRVNRIPTTLERK